MIKVEHWSNGNIQRIEVRNEKGVLHNPNGPAYQSWYENGQEWTRSYCVDNVYHNPNGPAVQNWHENGQEKYRSYWVDGKEFTEAKFKEFQASVEVTCGGKTVRIPKTQAIKLGLIDKPKTTRRTK